MRALLAVVCAHSRPEFVKTIRETWLPIFQVRDVDVRLFFGRGAGREPLEDEIFLDCGDQYVDLPEKVREIVRWALKNDYDRLLKCDDDVVVHPSRFIDVVHSGSDFVGRKVSTLGPPSRQVAVPYGFCYWLSRKAMEILADSELPRAGDNNDEWWVAGRLYDHQMYLCNDGRYSIVRLVPTRPLRKVTPRRPLRPTIQDETPEGIAWCVHPWSREASVKERCAMFRKTFEGNVVSGR